MQSEWPEYQLREILERVVDNRGKTPPNTTERSPYELIEVNALRSSSKFPNYTEVRKFVSRITFEKWFRSGHPQSGDVLISTVGSIGEVAISEGRGCIAQNVVALRGNNEILEGEYLYYYLSSNSVKAQLLSLDISSVQPSIKVPHLLDLYIPVPSLLEQRNIAHILGSLDDKIELNRQMNATLEAMAQALFKSWFVDFDPVLDNALAAGNLIPDELQDKAAAREALGDARKPLPEDIAALFPAAFVWTEEMGWIPEGWESTKLVKLLEVKYGKDHKKLNDGNIPVYGSGGLMRYADQSLYTGESILIPRKGTLSNLMYVNEEFWSVDTMFFSVPRHPNSAKYLFYFLKTFDFAAMNVGSAVPSMTTQVLNDLNTLKPNENILQVFDSHLINLFTKMQSLEKTSAVLAKLRDTLLPKLLSGELRIPDAEKLVEEIL